MMQMKLPIVALSALLLSGCAVDKFYAKSCARQGIPLGTQANTDCAQQAKHDGMADAQGAIAGGLLVGAVVAGSQPTPAPAASTTYQCNATSDTTATCRPH